jgi:hypothetical protein
MRRSNNKPRRKKERNIADSARIMCSWLDPISGGKFHPFLPQDSNIWSWRIWIKGS